MTEPASTPSPDRSLDRTLDQVAGALRRAREEFSFEARVERFGRVVSLDAGVAVVAGLTGVRGDELLRFENGGLGMAFNVEERTCGVVLLDKGEALSAGELVRRTGRVADTPVGDGLAGRIVNALGVPLDGRGPLRHSGGGRRVPVERPAPAIMDRSPVTEPLRTGLKVVDALIPVGLGQRELILGDRQSGKTAIALDAIINQRGRNVACFYCAVGQRASSVAKVVAALVAGGAMDHTTVVVATEEDPPGLQFLTPYAATSMAEEVMAQGGDALVVYDDLTRHARAYRELSLLLRRPPGREAFPGDIFYIHSRLLERATHLTEDLGGGSLTALPIVETEAQNISAYIPTNLISITDGQIYLSPGLFHKGVLPAVDVGRSVSRVGGKAQLPAYRAVVGDLRLAYSQFEELESFSRFGTRLDEETRKRLERGRRVREVLKQPRLKPLTTAEQVFALVALTRGVFDSRDPEGLDRDEEVVLTALNQGMADVARVVEEGGELSPDDLERIADAARRALGLSAGPGAEEEGR